MKILVTGAAGFLGQYVVHDLIQNGHTVIGVDNFSKYGKVYQPYLTHPQYTFIEGDVKSDAVLEAALDGCDQLVAMAALVGGVEYFHKFPYDIMSENEKITAQTFDQAIKSYKKGILKKINLISSSMVYEQISQFPLNEVDIDFFPAPESSYGFQKRCSEMFAKAAFEQYGLPYTIIRPFNCIGIGEYSIEKNDMLLENNKTKITSHVIPDLITKIFASSRPLEILGDGQQVRSFTWGGDLARGIRYCIEKPEALNESFNLATSESTKVVDLAKCIWSILRPQETFHFKTNPPPRYDVNIRIPDVSKAQQVLGFTAERQLNSTLVEIVDWMKIHVLNKNRMPENEI